MRDPSPSLTAVRGNAERRALFVGLWPPMFWLIGDALDRHRAIAGRRWVRRLLS